MTKKILAPLSAVAVMALMAVSLVVSGGSATAAVNGISVDATTVDRGDVVTLTIDADAGTDVRIIATGGDFLDAADPLAINGCLDAAAAACVLNPPPGATDLTGANDRDANIDGGVNNVDTLFVEWEAPDVAGSVSFTVIQGSSTRTATVTVRGAADTVNFSILRTSPVPSSSCVGTAVEVLQSTTASDGETDGVLCTIVTDANGIRIANQPVIYSTTAGSISPLTDTTSASGGAATTSQIDAGGSGVSGTTATVTASSGGKTATDTVKFGGDPASCTVTVDPTSVSVGGSSIITVEVLDSAGGPIPDDQSVWVEQANPGSGANAAILDHNPETVNGSASTTAIAAIAGAIAIGAASDVGNVSCTTTLIATGSVVPPNQGGTGDGSFAAAPNFGSGNVGSAVFNGGSIEDLADAVSDAGGTGVWVQGTNGNWYRYTVGATGATGFVNNAFNAQFEAGFAGATAVFVVK